MKIDIKFSRPLDHRKHAKLFKGQGLIEYALLIGLVALVAIVILSVLGMAATRVYALVAGSLGAEKNDTVTGVGDALSINSADCYVIPANNPTFCPGPSCGTVSLVTSGSLSSNIPASSLSVSSNSSFASYTTSGISVTDNGNGTADFTQQVSIVSADSAVCPTTVVVQSARNTAIHRVTTTIEP